MQIPNHPNATITFLIEHDSKFILIKRAPLEENFPGVWAFPGGKVEFSETGIDTIRREISEELSLSLKDEGAFLDTYWFKKSVGFAFLVKATNNKVVACSEIIDYTWVSSVDDLRNLKCIPGIYNHLVRANEVLARGQLDSLDKMNLTVDRYINPG